MDDLAARFVNDLLGRLTGPMKFRILLQPAMGLFFAIRDGLRDAREGQPPYFWAIFTNADARRSLIRQGWKAVLRIIVLGIVMDAIYELFVIRGIRPAELVVVVFVLACLPYLLLRGPINRIASRYGWIRR